MLKYSLNQAHRLSFMKNMTDNNADYTMEGTVTEAALDELLRQGKHEKLLDFIQNGTLLRR
jgi:hypothetical protein